MARGKAGDLAKFQQLRQARPLYEELADLLRQKIANGELAPGERLPSEVDLALALGVGRPSLREALKILQALGVVSIRHGAGIYVTRTAPDEIARRLTPPPSLPPERLRDLFEVRKTLECQAAAWAAQRADENALQALAAQVAKMTNHLEGGSEGTAPAVPDLAGLDITFHRLLALSTGNAALIGLLDAMEGMIGETMNYSLAIPGRPVQSVFDHRRIYQAVAAHRPLAAAKSMFSHIEGVERDVFALRTREGHPAPPRQMHSESESLLVLTYQEAAQSRD
ncbi:MAG: FCD domain-containing protein [Chloroflexi bacterium]|nr:FCD domain-containing protein [Chloroflexota bacterium]MCL5108093.1 FCD domain-containing protein [Chloroflexota bacterium]